MSYPTTMARSTIKGVTLLEALIYVGLTTFIIAGVLVSVYPLFTGTERLSVKAAEDTELAFLIGKVSFMLSSSTPLASPSIGASSSMLCLGPVCDSTALLKLQGNATGTVFLFVVGNAGIPITSSRVKVTNLVFTRIPGVGGLPDMISIECDIGGRHYGPIYKYART